MKITRDNARHFRWLDGRAEGWVFLEASDLHVLYEILQPGDAEKRHCHATTRQLYFVVGGEGSVDVEGVLSVVGAGESIAIPPGTRHKLTNAAREPLEFLVISSNAPRSDREDLE